MFLLCYLPQRRIYLPLSPSFLLGLGGGEDKLSQ